MDEKQRNVRAASLHNKNEKVTEEEKNERIETNQESKKGKDSPQCMQEHTGISQIDMQHLYIHVQHMSGKALLIFSTDGTLLGFI